MAAKEAHFQGEVAKAKMPGALGWEPTVNFKELVAMMVAAEVARVGLSGNEWRVTAAD